MDFEYRILDLIDELDSDHYLQFSNDGTFIMHPAQRVVEVNENVLAEVITRGAECCAPFVFIPVI